MRIAISRKGSNKVAYVSKRFSLSQTVSSGSTFLSSWTWARRACKCVCVCKRKKGWGRERERKRLIFHQSCTLYEFDNPMQCVLLVTWSIVRTLAPAARQRSRSSLRYGVWSLLRARPARAEQVNELTKHAQNRGKRGEERRGKKREEEGRVV